MTKEEIKSENSVASSVVILCRAVNVTTCYSQITHSSDLKEQVIWYLNVFTGILAVTAFFSIHTYPHAQNLTDCTEQGVQLASAFFYWLSWAYFTK